MSAIRAKSSTKVCCFCNLADDNELDYGKFYEHNGIVTHYYCLLLSSNMEQKGNDNEGILGFLTEDIQKELRRGKRLVCSYCKKIGATLGCCNLKCKRIFHFPCGLKAGSLHQYFGEFRSYCINHRPKQIIDNYILNQVSSLEDVLCYICYDKVNPHDPVGTLWAACCKKNAWFHRKCVQQLALSAGYFFKCPLCNNKKDFQNAMLEHGIFIPSQDASWELVPNAFEELLYRHDQCDAKICLCPKGRKHTSSNAKWELTLCRTCGSQGIHMSCGRLKWANPMWECEECISILRNSKESENTGDDTELDSNSDSSSQDKDSDSGDSDTDISVGIEYPMPSSLSSPSSSCISLESTDSSIKLRPGPRSFKLQQMKADKMAKCTSEFANTVSTNNIINKTNSEDIDKLSSTNNELKKESLTNNKSKSELQNNSQQTSVENDFVEDKKLFSNEKSQLILNEEDIILIESDDDEIEIIALRQKDLSIVQTMHTTNVLNSSRSTVILKNPTAKSTTSAQNTSATTVADIIKTDNIDQQEPTVSESVLSKNESITLGQSNATTPQQESTQDITSNSDDLENTNVIDANASPIMNIKITNVTSLPPEVFANVPDEGHQENDTWLQMDSTVNTSVADKLLEKWLTSPLKSDTHKEDNLKRKLEVVCVDNNFKLFLENSNMDNKCKKIKGDNVDQTFMDSHVPGQEQNQRMFEAKSDENIKDVSKCTTPTYEILNLLPNDNQKHQSTQSIHKTIKLSHSNDTSKIIQSNTPLYLEIPMSDSIVAPTKPASDSNCTKNENVENKKNVIYATTTLLPCTVINNQTTSVNQPIIANIIGPNNANNNQTGALNKQEVSLMKEKLSDNVSSVSCNSPSKMTCDGDAGGTHPAVMPRSACFYENAGISDTSETDSRNWRRESSDKSRAKSRRSVKRKVPSENDTVCTTSIRSCGSSARTYVFPQVTNNHNACHQPRLIPQYVHLHDLKFQVRGSDSIQMILYDTFSVNIPAEKNPLRQGKARLDVTAREPKEYAFTLRDEAFSSLNDINGTPIASWSSNDRTKCVATAVLTTVRDHDDAKENLDPASRNAVLSNVGTMSGNDSASANEYNESDGLVSSDTNLSRTICNTHVDSKVAADGLVTNDRNQNSQVNWDKQSVQHVVEDRIIGTRLFCNRTVRNIDFDLNVVNTNKNVEKILQDDINVSTNRHVDDGGISSDRTDDSLMLCSSNSSCASTNNRRKSNSCKHSDGTNVTRVKAQDHNIMHMSNIVFNERSISNKQISACDSKQFLRYTTFHENIVNQNINDDSECNIDSPLKVSIDLCKLQNLIDSKPELFVNLEDDDDRWKCMKTYKLRDEDDCTQQQVKYDGIENSSDVKHNPSGNSELSNSCPNDIERIQKQDSLSNANSTFPERYRKQKCGIRYFDKRISNR